MRGQRCVSNLQSIFHLGLRFTHPSDSVVRTRKTSTIHFPMPLHATSVSSFRKDLSDHQRLLSSSTVVSREDFDDEIEHKFHEVPYHSNIDQTSLHVASNMRQRKEINLHQSVCEGINAGDIATPSYQIEPKYSFHRRILPGSLTQFSSPEGRDLFKVSLASQYAEAYFPLAEQFLSQSDPAFCGITSLVMVLNAMGVDPNVRWKGGWRWYGSEEMLLDSCCVDANRVKMHGISMEEFQGLGRCQGLSIELKRPSPIEGKDLEVDLEIDTNYYTVDDFRDDIVKMVRNPPAFKVNEQNSNGEGGFMVVSFDRSSLGQTGEGHFSPIAAYHEETDQCLVLDVARFKYAPYWVPINDLYLATKPKDTVTDKSRGWFMIYAGKRAHRRTDSLINDESNGNQGLKTTSERKRPAEIVPISGKVNPRGCPVGEVKIQYCSVGK